jgi:hypothetical protein
MTQPPIRIPIDIRKRNCAGSNFDNLNGTKYKPNMMPAINAITTPLMSSSFLSSLVADIKAAPIVSERMPPIPHKTDFKTSLRNITPHKNEVNMQHPIHIGGPLAKPILLTAMTDKLFPIAQRKPERRA